jgi:hypothetical protein
MWRGVIEWWAGLSPWIRFGVAGGFILLSTVILLFGRIWIWGWVIGVVLLLCSFPSKPERKGYHDF